MEFTPFEEKTIEALEDCAGAVRHCSKNAVKHLRKAWEIRNIDLEMTIFRGITAEEEAASALIYCLKNHRYKNAKRLNFRLHTHKLGLFPFLQGIGKHIGEFTLQKSNPISGYTAAHIEKSGRKAMELAIHMPSTGYSARPIPPLHFTVSDHDNGEVITFENEFEELVQGESYKSALDYVKKIAHTRNRLLYASSGGIPKVTSPDIEAFIAEQKRKVMVYLSIVLMIDPWEKEEGTSLFVQQALDSYLLLLDQIDAEDVFQPNK